MILYRCPNCKTRIWYIAKTIRKRATCPVCKENFYPSDTNEERISPKKALGQIFADLPLLDLGSREREVVLNEEDLIFLGEMFLDLIMDLDQWQGLTRQELNLVSERLKESIEILEAHDQDSKLARLEFNLLNAFIRNFYD